MKETVINWMGLRVRQKGVLAVTAVFSDRSLFNHSFSTAYPQGALEVLGHALQDLAQLMGKQRVAASRIKWLFENAQVLTTMRHDGVILALVCLRNSASLDVAAIERLLAEFEELS